MKKVVIIANNSGGLYNFRKELISHILQEGNIVTILTPFDHKIEELKKMEIKLLNTPLDRRGMNFIKDLNLLFRYIVILKKERADLVITYTIKPNIYGGIAARFLKIPYVENITGLGTAFQKEGLLHIIVVALYKISLKRAKVVFFENSNNCKTMQRFHIIKNSQCFVLNGAGVDTEYFSKISYPNTEDPIRFLFIGRIMKEKGIDELFKAMEYLYNDSKNCVLDVLGPYEENYEYWINKYEKQGWLHYYGYQSDIRPYIESSHCFVLPSYHEGMANTNLENAASGRPLIVTNIPGCREAVLENISGFLCEPKDVSSLYNAMKKFMDLSLAEKKQMGNAGRKYMENCFDKKKIVEKTCNVLKDRVR